MKREPPFKPDPTRSGEYINNLAGSVLLAGDTAYGDPTDTTPEGQAVAHVLIDRFLNVAVAAARREERLALKALAKLCDQAMPVEDALTVDEVRALPRIETVEMG